MKTKHILAFVLLFAIYDHQHSTVFAQGTGFTYQGRLNGSAGPATGLYDMHFSLYTVASGGSSFAGPLSIPGIAVSNGLFTATLDFGANIFNGTSYWLELSVATNGGGSFDTLSPRQSLAPSPYAEYAAGAATATAVAGTNITGTVPDPRLSANVALRMGGNTFSGPQIITNGNVGIGTTAPAQPLQVGDANITGSQGMMRFGSRTSSGGGILRTWDIGVPQTGDNLTGLGYSFVINDATIASNMMVIQYQTGNVGFGNTNPVNRLSVGNPLIFAGGYGLQVSSATYGADVQINNPGGIGLLLHNNAGGNATMLQIRNGTTDTNVFTVSGNGTVNAAGTVTANGVLLTSDRNVKENFQPISPEEVLDKVAALPIEQWNFKADTATRHIGPMAQDFYTAFRVGPDDTHISMVDEGGVALAAIQGLNEKVQSSKQDTLTRLQKLEAENAELRARLEKIEQLLERKPGLGR